MQHWVKNNTIIICATVIVLWAITAATILVVTGNTGALRSAVIALAPIVPSLLTLLGINQRVKEVKEQTDATHEMITNGDVTDASP
jgi:hypothetical protein